MLFIISISKVLELALEIESIVRLKAAIDGSTSMTAGVKRPFLGFFQ
jgi:hypothetical protein